MANTSILKVAGILLLTFLSESVLAQQAAPDNASRAAAEALFQQGRQLMDKQQYAEACEKLDASNKLDPGVGTLLYLGDCYEKSGRVASAWAAFEEAGSVATSRGEMERVKVAQVRAAALKPRIPLLVFEVSGKVPGLELRRDGALIPEASWGSALPVDPGEHSIVALADGYEKWQSQIKVPANLKEPWTVRIPALKPMNAEPATPATERSTTQVTVSENSASNDGSAQRLAGLVVGGFGAVAAIISGILTGVAAGKNRSSKDKCLPGEPNSCSGAGVSERDDALSLANIATVAGVAGGVALAGGAVIYFTASSGESSTPNGAMLQLGGHF